MEAELKDMSREIALEIVASVKIGNYDRACHISVEESFTSEEAEHLASEIGQCVSYYIRKIIADEKLHIWLNANYDFSIVATDDKKDKLDIVIGYIKKTNMKTYKKNWAQYGAKIAKMCAYCKIATPKQSKCAACQCVSYCCKEHQVADWKEHKQFCKSLKDAKE